MKKYQTIFMIQLIFAALLFTSGCGDTSTTSRKTSLVTISIGGGGTSASLVIRPATLLARTELQLRRAWKAGLAIAAGIPAEVASVSIIVSASDMSTISRTIPVLAGQQQITDTFEVPNGIGRLFKVNALNTGGNTIYSNQATRDLNGTAVEIPFSMQVVAPLGSLIVLGTVTDSVSKAPISGATITFSSQTPVTTGTIGMYFVTLTAGMYQVSVSAPGYATQTLQNIQVAPSATGGFVTINFTATQL